MEYPLDDFISKLDDISDKTLHKLKWINPVVKVEGKEFFINSVSMDEERLLVVIELGNEVPVAQKALEQPCELKLVMHSEQLGTELFKCLTHGGNVYFDFETQKYTSAPSHREKEK